MTEKELDQVAEKVATILQNKNKKTKFDPDWLALRDEIEEYCRQQDEADLTKIRFTTLQSKIHDAIRVVCNVTYLYEITGEKVAEARKVFQFIKDERAAQIAQEDK